MTSRLIRVFVPAPVAVPRGAVWLGLLLDWAASRVTQAAKADLTHRFATEAGK